MYKCKECSFQTEKLSELANHYQYSHKENKNIKCERCGKIFTNEKGLKLHTIGSCNKQLENNKINHICPKCDKYIPNSIEKHINSCGKLKIKKPSLLSRVGKLTTQVRTLSVAQHN